MAVDRIGEYLSALLAKHGTAEEVNISPLVKALQKELGARERESLYTVFFLTNKNYDEVVSAMNEKEEEKSHVEKKKKDRVYATHPKNASTIDTSSLYPHPLNFDWVITLDFMKYCSPEDVVQAYVHHKMGDFVRDKMLTDPFNGRIESRSEFTKPLYLFLDGHVSERMEEVKTKVKTKKMSTVAEDAKKEETSISSGAEINKPQVTKSQGGVKPSFSASSALSSSVAHGGEKVGKVWRPSKPSSIAVSPTVHQQREQKSTNGRISAPSYVSRTRQTVTGDTSQGLVTPLHRSQKRIYPSGATMSPTPRTLNQQQQKQQMRHASRPGASTRTIPSTRHPSTSGIKPATSGIYPPPYNPQSSQQTQPQQPQQLASSSALYYSPYNNPFYSPYYTTPYYTTPYYTTPYYNPYYYNVRYNPYYANNFYNAPPFSNSLF
eukprot:Nk52_evm5s317 gene=Nk52_evmTU5s317